MTVTQFEKRVDGTKADLEVFALEVLRMLGLGKGGSVNISLLKNGAVLLEKESQSQNQL